MRNRGVMVVATAFILGISSLSLAQINPLQIEEFLRNDAALKKNSIQYPAEIKEVYSSLQYQPIWVNNSPRIRELMQLFQQADNLGLNIEDYQSNTAQTALRNPEKWSNIDLLVTELNLTDEAIHFVKDISEGNEPLRLDYNGLNYYPDCISVSRLLVSAIQNNNLLTLPIRTEQNTPEYLVIKKQIQWFNSVMAEYNFKEVVIKSTGITADNKELIIKFYQLGLLDSVTKHLQKEDLKTKICQAQHLFNLPMDSVLRSSLISALNVKLRNRLEELNQAINIIRYLSCIKRTSSVIIANIPSASIHAYQEGKIIFDSRIIVGKRTTPTPTLSSIITDVILYPYWMVPFSIATKELLPAIKRNIKYLNAGRYQVIDKSGKIVNPYSIDWQSLNRSNFPYSIRQSTGCDNSLGIIKFNFYNPFGVYLHDTPLKKLFSYNKRYLSHGCIRVQKTMELAHLVLQNNKTALDTLENKGCLTNKAPVAVPADQQFPVFIIYSTVWVDSSGQISFNEDIYRKLPSLKKNNRVTQ